MMAIKNVLTLKAKGQVATATITAKHIIRRLGNTTYRVAYAFESEGRQYANNVPVSKKCFDTYKEGGKIKILFLKNVPKTSVIETDVKRILKISVFLSFLLILAATWILLQ